MKQYWKLYDTDIELLKNQMIIVNCPACDSSKNNQWVLKKGFTFVECQNCSTVFVNPRPNKKTLEEFYTKTKTSVFWDKIFKETEKTRIEKIFKPRVALVKEILKKYDVTCKKMVEVGAGYGWFCKLVKDQNIAEEIIAIEPSPTIASECRKVGINVIESTIEKCPNELGADLIVSFELVHLLFNPGSFLTECFKNLKQKGLLIFSLTNLFGFDIQNLKEKSDYVGPTFLNRCRTVSRRERDRETARLSRGSRPLSVHVLFRLMRDRDPRYVPALESASRHQSSHLRSASLPPE